MKLILQAIKALFRKVENALENVKESLEKVTESLEGVREEIPQNLDDLLNGEKISGDRIEDMYYSTWLDFSAEVETVESGSKYLAENLGEIFGNADIWGGTIFQIVFDGTRYELAFEWRDDQGGFGDPVLYEHGASEEGHAYQYPFYLYKSSSGDSYMWHLATLTGGHHTIEVKKVREAITSLDEKYLPDGVSRDAINQKLDAENPTGQGSILMNTPYNASAGLFSSVFGRGNMSYVKSQHVIGEYCKFDPKTYRLTLGKEEKQSFKNADEFYYSSECVIDGSTGRLSLVSPAKTTIGLLLGKANIYICKYPDSANGIVYYKVDTDYTTSGQSRIFKVQRCSAGINNIEARGELICIVGNGKTTQRSNAHTLDWDGNAWYAGSVEGKAMILPSTSEGSTKRFQITVDDSGTITATEITE